MQYYNKMLLITELPEHKLMDWADLTDGGHKCFCNFRLFEFTTNKPVTEKEAMKLKEIFSNSEEVEEAELIILNGKIIHDRKKYDILSDGEHFELKRNIIAAYCGEVEEDVIVN